MVPKEETHAGSAATKGKSTVSKDTKKKKSSQSKKQQVRPREFNARCWVYTASAAFGLVGIASLSSVDPSTTNGQISNAEKISGLLFSVVSFLINIVVIVADFCYR
jgi:hypothetical protein